VSPTSPQVTVVGGGLAGCEAALQLARLGIAVELVEMRPVKETPAHSGESLAQIVCSNSLKSTAPATASGLLKDELDILGCQLLALARKSAVPAGSALAVDKAVFSQNVAEALAEHPLVTVSRREIDTLPLIENHIWLVATGPMSSQSLINQLGEITGQPGLHFFDAIAPTVTHESLDLSILYRAARYGKGEDDYLNAPLDEEQYAALHADLLAADKAEVHEFDRAALFDGCQPIEEIAASGPMSMSFGPLRPVGLDHPETGKRPHAVVQLRQENLAGTLYGLVGFQTRLKFGEQKRVLRKIPGLAKAEIVRYGQLHRNFYLDTPRCCQRDFSLSGRPDVFIAGQITGVEGYVESIASGLYTAWQVASRLREKPVPALPLDSMLGSLLRNFLFDITTERLSPMNVNFGLLPDLATKVRNKRDRKIAKSEVARQALSKWVAAEPVTALLAAIPD
jgi:methylenetetrahydrofolate--tRNA-(uracil-5-)-methyltransferase